MNLQATSLPNLLFGDTQAFTQRNFYTLVDHFSDVIDKADFDTSNTADFIYKGCALMMDGLMLYHSVISNFQVNSHAEQYTLSLVLAGESRVQNGHRNYQLSPNQALLTPPQIPLLRAVNPNSLSVNLCISFDLKRLNQVSLTMQGDDGLPVTQTHLRTVELHYGPINLRQLFIQLIQQIDAYASNTTLLQHAGFDDQMYRLLAITLQPEVFLKNHLSHTEYLATQRRDILATFERYVEEHLHAHLSLTEIERRLGVSARTLQYACLKRHNCSPMTYIRNRKLDYAYEYLLRSPKEIKLSELAAQLFFSNQSQFSRHFRERFGFLPSELKTRR